MFIFIYSLFVFDDFVFIIINIEYFRMDLEFFLGREWFVCWGWEFYFDQKNIITY